MKSRVGLLLLIGLALAAPAPDALALDRLFPADNIWNTPVDRLPVAANSTRT